LVVSLNLVRLSLKKTAYVAVDKIDSQPFRAGLTFGGRPSGPRIQGDFAVSFLSQLAIGKLAAPNEQKNKPIESISISSVHFTLNLPQASQLLGMTNCRAALTSAAVAGEWTEHALSP
jgi:hypothetical protein